MAYVYSWAKYREANIYRGPWLPVKAPRTRAQVGLPPAPQRRAVPGLHRRGRRRQPGSQPAAPPPAALVPSGIAHCCGRIAAAWHWR
ncbi:hypothetical protein CHLRE_17g697250v5 [Chlamydomonas reinhardtii]|uniref:Uncharacterized protein n=1 Tax=Chlamydomonas reinhardtii TaxID=3055 RepID=A0A2K3CNP7_CHLRE|nr:uncharacterized protein CHLRE_17g697250v5 [Chlamydomonas reinhardtii]PNW69895.1 hypothetical protein CHLRE_17g697250v5 [Chlamydomonas reinhardtii]